MLGVFSFALAIVWGGKFVASGPWYVFEQKAWYRGPF